MRKLTVAFALTCAVTSTAAFAESVWVKAASVDVRENKGAVYPSLITAPKGTELTVVKREGQWVQVQTGGKTGWVFANSVSSSKVGGEVNLMPGASAEMGTGIAARGLQPGAETYVSSRGLSKAGLEHLIAVRKSINPQEWTKFSELKR
jgi:uncharacterized protein YraI